MVATYWDMAASFVNTGVLNEELFYSNSRESLLVWVRMRNVIPEIRAGYKDPTFLKHLETVSRRFEEHLNRMTPGTYDAFVARIGG